MTKDVFVRETHSHQCYEELELPIGLYVLVWLDQSLSPMHPESKLFKIEVRCFLDECGGNLIVVLLSVKVFNRRVASENENPLLSDLAAENFRVRQLTEKIVIHILRTPIWRVLNVLILLLI